MARARRRRPATDLPAELGADVPAELRDPDAAVWHDQKRYRHFMAAHGWTLPPAERIGCTTSPRNRRSTAAAAWAHQTGVATRTYGDSKHPLADFHQLRELGLCD